jgi:hypothetical protein
MIGRTISHYRITRHLHPLLPGWSNPQAECCGNWTPDGRYFVFQSVANTSNLWAIREKSGFLRSRNPEPVQLTTRRVRYDARTQQ